jgi:serine O-acetyltransferase
MTPGVQAAIVYRLGRWSKAKGGLVRCFGDPIYMVLHFGVKAIWGIDLPRSAQVGPGLYIGHFGGIVVSGRAAIGANCNLSQGVTIGCGEGDNAGAAPTIGDCVYIAPGAKVFGRIRVGNNVKIGANAVVYKDIPDNAIVILAPGFQIVSMKGNRSKLKVAP